jgi:large subunit ribosomal protein L10
MNALRAALRKNGARYRISKNTLSRLAADEIGKPEMKDLIDGPVGWVYTMGDPSGAAKSLVEHLDDARVEMEIRGALMDGNILTTAQLEALAKLPSRDVLLAMLMGQMNAPVRGLATVLAGPVRGLAVVLQRISELASAATEEDAPAEDDAEAEVAPEASAEEEAPAEAESAPEEEAAPAEAASEEPEAAAEKEETDSSGDDSEAEEKPEGEGGEEEA